MLLTNHVVPLSSHVSLSVMNNLIVIFESLLLDDLPKCNIALLELGLCFPSITHLAWNLKELGRARRFALKCCLTLQFFPLPPLFSHHVCMFSNHTRPLQFTFPFSLLRPPPLLLCLFLSYPLFS